MNPKEKELLDYLYTVGQNVRDFMRRNDYRVEGGRRVVSIDVILSTCEEYDHIDVYASEHVNGDLKRMIKKEDNIIENTREYKVVKGED